MRIAMLTTVDNPFDPFDEHEQWAAFDASLGYNTEAIVARLTLWSENLSLADQLEADEQAIDDLVKTNVTGVYRKVVRDLPDPEF
jgi:hypothetical protein